MSRLGGPRKRRHVFPLTREVPEAIVLFSFGEKRCRLTLVPGRLPTGHCAGDRVGQGVEMGLVFQLGVLQQWMKLGAARVALPHLPCLLWLALLLDLNARRRDKHVSSYPQTGASRDWRGSAIINVKPEGERAVLVVSRNQACEILFRNGLIERPFGRYVLVVYFGDAKLLGGLPFCTECQQRSSSAGDTLSASSALRDLGGLWLPCFSKNKVMTGSIGRMILTMPIISADMVESQVNKRPYSPDSEVRAPASAQWAPICKATASLALPPHTLLQTTMSSARQPSEGCAAPMTEDNSRPGNRVDVTRAPARGSIELQRGNAAMPTQCQTAQTSIKLKKRCRLLQSKKHWI